MDLAQNRITSTELGKPVMIKSIVGRIVAHAEEGSSGIINDKEIFSILEISTPHGSLIKSGVMFIDEITPEGLEQLKKYEQELVKENKPLYLDKLKNIITNY